MVARKDAHNAGGYYWCDDQRTEFADDKDNLVITHKDVNLEKSAHGPADWLTDTDYDIPDERVCAYLLKYLETKNRYGLEIGERQRVFISDKGTELECWDSSSD